MLRELVDRLVDLTRRYGREVVYVGYEDGDGDLFVLEYYGGAFPVRKKPKVIVHTHPVPRWTPSIADIMAAYRWKCPFITIAQDPSLGIVAYEIRFRRDVPVGRLMKLVNECFKFEEAMGVYGGEEVSRAQHGTMIGTRDITITRYVFKQVLGPHD